MQVGSFPEQAKKIADGLGGLANIRSIEAQVTALAAEVADPALVSKEAVLAAPAWDAEINGNAVRIVVGATARQIATDINAMLG